MTGLLKALLLISVLASTLLFPLSPCAADSDTQDDTQDLPWERGYVDLGAYFADMNTSFRLGASNVGIGVSIDAEEFLGLTTNDSAFRIDAGYRLSKSKRHMLDLGWFSFDRESEKKLGEDVVLPPEMGGDTLYVGTVISSFFKFDIIKLKYKYALILDDRVDMSLGVGFYIMPVRIGLGRKGDELKDEDVTAPLPVFGLGADVILTKHWLLRQNLDLFFLKIGDFKGSIINAQAAVEYSNWKHWGVGAGVDGLQLRIQAEGKDYLNIDFVGNIKFSYFGAQLYVKFLY